MHYKVRLSPLAQSQYNSIQATDEKKFKKVLKTLGLIETNTRHPSLSTHEFDGMKGPEGAKVFEAYVENRTPAAYRLFFSYYPNRGDVYVIAITKHP